MTKGENRIIIKIGICRPGFGDAQEGAAMEDKQKLMRCAVVLIAVLLAVVCLASILVVPRTLRALEHAERTLSNADGLIKTADRALATATEAVGAANRLVEENADNVSGMMEKINAIDFDALNRAIGDLADIIAPLARLVGLLGR